MKNPLFSSIVEIDKLPSIKLRDRKKLPAVSGIYFVLQNDSIIYIGQAISFLHRWNSHHLLEKLDQLSNVRIAWKEMLEVSLFNEIEKSLVQHFEPELNVSLKNINESTASPSSWISTTAVERFLLGDKNFVNEMKNHLRLLGIRNCMFCGIKLPEKNHVIPLEGEYYNFNGWSLCCKTCFSKLKVYNKNISEDKENYKNLKISIRKKLIERIEEDLKELERYFEIDVGVMKNFKSIIFESSMRFHFQKSTKIFSNYSKKQSE